jgi:hypothetical protein
MCSRYKQDSGGMNLQQILQHTWRLQAHVTDLMLTERTKQDVGVKWNAVREILPITTFLHGQPGKTVSLYFHCCKRHWCSHCLEQAVSYRAVLGWLNNLWPLEPCSATCYNYNSVALVRERTIPTEGPTLVVKLVPTFADRGCCVVSAVDLYDRNLGFLDRSAAY